MDDQMPGDRTPSMSHAAYKVQIAALLDELREQVQTHGANETVNWGHVGDLAYVKDQLIDVAATLRGDEE